MLKGFLCYCFPLTYLFCLLLGGLGLRRNCEQLSCVSDIPYHLHLHILWLFGGRDSVLFRVTPGVSVKNHSWPWLRGPYKMPVIKLGSGINKGKCLTFCTIQSHHLSVLKSASTIPFYEYPQTPICSPLVNISGPISNFFFQD